MKTELSFDAEVLAKCSHRLFLDIAVSRMEDFLKNHGGVAILNIAADACDGEVLERGFLPPRHLLTGVQILLRSAKMAERADKLRLNAGLLDGIQELENECRVLLQKEFAA